MTENSKLIQHLLDHENDPETDKILLKLLDDAPSKDPKLVQEGLKEFSRRTGVRKAYQPRPWLRFATGIAASLFLPLLILSVWALVKNESKADTEWIVASTTFAETSEVILPDGSTVTLQPCSQLFYPENFYGKQRKVLLSGEAFLDVTKDARKQFVVSAGKMDIVVHGTRFSVCSFPENEEDEVALLEGSVEMRPHGQNNSVFLAPGEMLKFNKKDASMQRRHFAVNYYEEVLRSGGLQFDNQVLSAIAAELTRHFNINVIVDNKALARERYYALFINGEGIDEILSALGASGHFRVVKTDNTIHLTK